MHHRRFRRKIRNAANIAQAQGVKAVGEVFGLPDLLRAASDFFLLGLGMEGARIVFAKARGPHGEAARLHPENDLGGDALKVDERQEGRSEVVGEVARPKGN